MDRTIYVWIGWLHGWLVNDILMYKFNIETLRMATVPDLKTNQYIVEQRRFFLIKNKLVLLQKYDCFPSTINISSA